MPCRLFADEAVLGELLLQLLRVGFGLVDLVHRHDDGHPGRFRVVDRLDGLRHHAVVRRDDEHDDVGDVRPAGAQRGKRLVARRIEEGHVAFLQQDFVGADVLGDPAGLFLGDLRLADRIEEARLAVIHVPHERHDRGARHELGRVRLARLDRLLFEGGLRRDLAMKRLRQCGGGRLIQRLEHRGEDPLLHQGGNQLARFDLHLLGEILDRNRKPQLQRLCRPFRHGRGRRNRRGRNGFLRFWGSLLWSRRGGRDGFHRSGRFPDRHGA